MDEDFACFLAEFGPAIDRRHVPPSTIARYRGKLPNQLLAYWEEYGWCGYGDGLFWTVNPQQYEPALEAWIGETPFMEQDAYHVIARSAFGLLYLWGEKTGDTLRLFAPASCCFTSASDDDVDRDFEMRVFFGSLWRDNNDVEGLFAPALRQLQRGVAQALNLQVHGGDDLFLRRARHLRIFGRLLDRILERPHPVGVALPFGPAHLDLRRLGTPVGPDHLHGSLELVRIAILNQRLDRRRRIAGRRRSVLSSRRRGSREQRKAGHQHQVPPRHALHFALTE